MWDMCIRFCVCVCCVSCMGGLLLHSGSIFCWLCSVVEMRLLHSGTVGKLLLSFLHWLTGVGFVVVQKNDVIDLFSDRACSHYDAYQSDSFSILRINLSLSPLHRSAFKMHYSWPLFLMSNIHFCCFPAVRCMHRKINKAHLSNSHYKYYRTYIPCSFCHSLFSVANLNGWDCNITCQSTRQLRAFWGKLPSFGSQPSHMESGGQRSNL